MCYCNPLLRTICCGSLECTKAMDNIGVKYYVADVPSAKYQVAHGPSLLALEMKVTSMMKEGWKCQGGMTMVDVSYSKNSYFQAMIHEGDLSKKANIEDFLSDMQIRAALKRGSEIPPPPPPPTTEYV